MNFIYNTALVNLEPIRYNTKYAKYPWCGEFDAMPPPLTATAIPTHAQGTAADPREQELLWSHSIHKTTEYRALRPPNN